MLPIAVLCGGKGTRVSKIACGLPKALIPIAGEPFMTHQLRWLARMGADEVVLLTGYGSDSIRAHVGDGSALGLRVRYSEDGAEPRGTAGAVLRALPALGERFIVLYGDSLTVADLNAIDHALESPIEGVMAVFRNEDRWMPSNVTICGDRVTAYNKEATPGTMSHIDYGVNAFYAACFRNIPTDRQIDLAEVHQILIARGTLRAFPVSERWHEIGSSEGIIETEQFITSQSRGTVSE